MKKLALAGLFSILATISLSGCNQAPVEEETQTPADNTMPVVQEEVKTEMSVYDASNIDIPIKFEYPSNMQLDVGELEVQNGALYVALSEKNNDLGYPLTLVRVTVEKDTYAEVMAEVADGPYFPIENKCENKDWANSVWNCETKGDWNTYFSIGHMGDISVEKEYFMETNNTGWNKVNVRVDLLTDELGSKISKKDESNSVDSIIKNYELDEEQLRRIELADALVASLTLK